VNETILKKRRKSMEASTVVAGTKAFGAKALAFMATPAFGVIALVGIVGWQYWEGKKDEKEMEEKAAA
jgi:predicted negative regulator of RcsB-dependent stress response